MHDNERDEEGIPQRESWQLDDEEPLSPLGVKTAVGEETNSIWEVPAGYLLEEIDFSTDGSPDIDEMISIDNELEEEAFEEDLDPFSCELEDAFSEVEGEVFTNRFGRSGLDEEWEGFQSGEDEEDDFEEFDEIPDEDFFELWDEDDE